MLWPSFLPLFTEVRGRHQPVEKSLRALFGSRFGGRIRRFCSILALFLGSLGSPTGSTPTFSTSCRFVGNGAKESVWRSRLLHYH